MLLFDQDQLERLDAAIASALRGEPRVVILHGGPGSGRSSMLATAVDHALAAGPFVHRTAGGNVSGDLPLRGLRDLGIFAGSVAGADTPTALATEQALRESIDTDLDEGPLLVTIDDLQWLDPETTTALAAVLSTAVAERMIVIVSTGHFEPFQHLAWQELVAGSPLAVAIEIRPLPLDAATAVARELRPEIRDVLAHRLWEHTQGNPLFFTSLLRRTSLADLERMEQLPAPDDYAHAIEVRLSTLGGDAIELARAASVVGVGWMPLAEAAHVADLGDPTTAVGVLTREFILETRMVKLGPEVRIVHAVIQASIYQNIPMSVRVNFHARAADVASEEPRELQHRYAAAATFDDELAERLSGAAEVQREERSHRLAAMYLDWASRLTADGLLRSRRLMDSYYEWVLAGSTEFVRDRMPDIRSARDRSGAALVQGMLEVSENEWLDAVRTLKPLADSGVNSLRTYRIEILLAWSSMCAGETAEAVLAPLGRAESMSVRDDTLAGLATFTRALIAGRRDRSDEIQTNLDRLPARPAAVPMDDTYWLAWRGLGTAFNGRVADAIEPLREVDSRMATGFINVGDGITHAFLGICYLLTGATDLAALPFRTAELLLRPRPNPFTAAAVATWYVHIGDRERADQLITAARTTLRDMPWDEAIHTLLASRVAFAHAFGTDAERANLIGEHRQDFGAKADKMHGMGPLARANVAIAYVWAGETDTADEHAAELEARSDLPWTASVAWWIRGLSAEKEGRSGEAFELLNRARDLDPGSTANRSARIEADLSRVAGLVGERTISVAAAERSQKIYVRIRAVPYLPAVELEIPEIFGALPSGEAALETRSAPPTPGLFGLLSERERDVAALVVRGMSYTQIAKELFITRSTVGFHLSRIYAKTATGTRHELSELVSREHSV